MDRNQLQFLDLLKSGLWNKKTDASLFRGNEDWNKIYTLSKQQAVLGIVLDGINKLPNDLRPPRQLYLKWCAEVLEIEDENIRLDKTISELFQLLEKNEISPILMKGQGIARNYPNPQHRSSGDIDIYVGKKYYDRVNNLLSLGGKQTEEWNSKHMGFVWHNALVENHRIMSQMNAPIANFNIQRTIEKWYKENKFETIVLEGQRVNLPPVDFDVVYILQHAVGHLMVYGVGLRQICDWILLLHNKQNVINKGSVFILLKKTGLIKSAKVFGALAVEYLGLPEKDLIVDYSKKDLEYAAFLLEDIWYNGNFGFSGERLKIRPNGWLKSRLVYLKSNLKRARELRKIVPEEARWALYKHLYYFVSSQLDKIGDD